MPRTSTSQDERFPHGALVRRRRLQGGLTQAQVAERAGLSLKRYQDIERGLNTSIRLLAAVAEALECDMTDLMEPSTSRSESVRIAPEYRRLFELLDVVVPSGRDEILRHATWSAGRAQKRPVELPTIENLVPFPSYADDDGDFP